MHIPMSSQYLAERWTALSQQHLCDMAILPHRSLRAIYAATILLTAKVHALLVLFYRVLLCSLSHLFRSLCRCNNSLDIAPILFAAPNCRRFSQGHFGILVSSNRKKLARIHAWAAETGMETWNAIQARIPGGSAATAELNRQRPSRT